MEKLQSPADVPKSIIELAVGGLRFIHERLVGGGWEPNALPKANITYFPEEDR